MIEYKQGDIMKDGSEAVVNTVNTEGVMGKGIALAFKKAYPQNFELYRKAYDEGKLRTGKMLVFQTGALFPKFIINFPTKKHWRNPSKMEYITEGLKDLVKVIQENKIESIAIPPLGCGNGKLDWRVVKPVIEAALEEVGSTTKVTIYEPGFQEEEKPAVNVSAKLTEARAMLLHLVHEYSKSGYAVNLLVVQKLAYFLQRSGVNLRLNFEKGWFGPYAKNLSYVLNDLNGTYIHFTAKSIKPETTVKLDEPNWQAVESFVNENLSGEQKSKLEEVVEMIEGFETPFGLELLSTVDFVKLNCPECSPANIQERIQSWTIRKKELMPLFQIETAYRHLLRQPIYQAIQEAL
jgi:O-acetyl-ADP-ribose deacetylase (regulator of RNase III)